MVQWNLIEEMGKTLNNNGRERKSFKFKFKMWIIHWVANSPRNFPFSSVWVNYQSWIDRNRNVSRWNFKYRERLMCCWLLLLLAIQLPLWAITVQLSDRMELKRTASSIQKRINSLKTLFTFDNIFSFASNEAFVTTFDVFIWFHFFVKYFPTDCEKF